MIRTFKRASYHNKRELLKFFAQHTSRLKTLMQNKVVTLQKTNCNQNPKYQSNRGRGGKNAINSAVCDAQIIFKPAVWRIVCNPLCLFPLKIFFSTKGFAPPYTLLFGHHKCTSVQKAVLSVIAWTHLCVVSAAQLAQVGFSEASFVSWVHLSQLTCKAQRRSSCYILGQMVHFDAFGQHSSKGGRQIHSFLLKIFLEIM